MIEQTPYTFLSRAECQVLFDRVYSMCTGGGDLTISVVSEQSGLAKWIRSDMHISSGVVTTRLDITRNIRGSSLSIETSRFDDEGLREAVATVERGFALSYRPYEHIQDPPLPDGEIAAPELWNDATYAYSAGARAELARQMLEPAAAAGMLAAGDLKIGAQGHARIDSDGKVRYYPVTVVECSMTVRNPKLAASGWAGVNHFSLDRIDPQAIAMRALQKAEQSANPVAIEPGRYTAILEPQAMADLFTPLIGGSLSGGAMDRIDAEEGRGPFAFGKDQSKIGQQVLDARLQLSADPMDSEAGFIPFDRQSGTPYRNVDWVTDGILKDLSYERRYALAYLGKDQALLNSRSYRLAPAKGVPTATIEEMIERTERGILVTRFSDVSVIDGTTMLSAGYTRDGVWLIENGKISKAVKNFRFTESPLFVLNSLLDVGKAERVFQPGYAVMAPAVRVRDFNFSSLADAV